MKTQKVLGLDLAKATLPDAIAAMVEAWYEAQGLSDEASASEKAKPDDELIYDQWWDRLCTYCPKLPNEFTTNQALIAYELVKSEKVITRADQNRIALLLKERGYVKDKQHSRLPNGRRGYLWRADP